MKIVFAYRMIDGIAGGMERMTAALMNELSTRGHSVQFVTLDHAAAQSFYPLSPSVIWHRIGLGDPSQKASWQQRWHRLRRIRTILKDFKPDVILGFQDGAFLQMRVAALGLGIPVVLAERIAPSHFDFTSRGKFKQLYFLLYNLAARILVQCPGYVQKYPFYLRHKIDVIPNFVYPSTEHAQPDVAKEGRKTLLCVGRIGYQKNQAALLEAFSQLRAEFPQWELQLAGSDDGTLQNQIAKLHLAESVQWLDQVQDVATLYRGAHLFCLPSRWEGFPNALAEALAHGLPAVGFAGCDGVADLILHERTGLLATGNGDVTMLVDALRTLMRDDALRVRMGEAAHESMHLYAPDRIFSLWEETLENVALRK